MRNGWDKVNEETVGIKLMRNSWDKVDEKQLGWSRWETVGIK